MVEHDAGVIARRQSEKTPFRPRASRFRRQAQYRLTKLTLQTLEGVLIAPLVPRRPVREVLPDFIRRGVPNRMRVAYLFDLLDRATGGLASRLSAALYRKHSLPFRGSKLELIGYGTGATVFMLRGGPERRVLKVYRRSLGRDQTGLLAVARAYRAKYQMIREWYSGEHSFVLPSDFVIVNGPLLGRPVAMCVQEYVPGAKADFFADHTDEQLLQMMREDADLRAQFKHFAECTTWIYSERGMCFDFLGRENLVLLETPVGLRLAIMDTGIVDVAWIRANRAWWMEKFDALMTRMANLYANVQSS